MEEQIEQTDGYKVIFINQGGFGKVYQGIKNNEKIIIKILKNQTVDQINSLRREGQILQRFSHENIIRLVEIREQLKCTYDDDSVQEMIGIKIEYAENGSLAQYEKPFSEGLCRYLFKQLLNGLNHLVENRICHRDIKPGNLVLDSQYTLKIIDFGLARENKSLQNNCGTLSYQAPEVGVQGRIYDGEKVDVFAAGVTLFEFYTGNKPFSEKDELIVQNENFILFLKNQQGEFWTKIRQLYQKKKFSNAFISLIDGMLNPNPHQRFTIQQCLNHEWMQGNIPVQQMVNLELQQNIDEQSQQRQQELRNQKKIKQMRSDRKRISEENLNYMRKQHKLNFENLKIKTDSLENILNYHISIVDPEILILELLYKLRKSNNPDIQIVFDKLSKKTYSIVFNLEKNYKEIGKIQIDLYKLENDLIRVNIIKLEGDFEDYLEAKQTLEQLLKEIG